MRLLHLIYDDVANPWLGGGGAVRTREINKRLAAHGHEVTVASGLYPGAAQDEVVEGVRYRRIGWPGWLAKRGYMGSRVAFVLGAIGLLKRSRYDIVIEDVSPYSPIFSPLWRRRTSLAIASVQNLSGQHATGKFGLSLRGLAPLLLERPLLRLFRNAIAVSPGIARQMAPWWRGPGRRLTVIPNSAASVLPANAEQAQPFILFLGRLDIYQKGLDRLIAAYALAAPQMPAVGLVIAGGGDTASEQKLDQLIANAKLKRVISPDQVSSGTVCLTGRLAPDDAARLLSSSLFMAVPSRYEAWPIVAIEAAAAGKPVLGSNIVGVRDAAPASAHGLLVADGDIAQLAAAMVRLATNKYLRQTLGERGRAWAGRFSWDNLANRQEIFYRETLAKSSGKPKRGLATLSR